MFIVDSHPANIPREVASILQGACNGGSKFQSHQQSLSTRSLDPVEWSVSAISPDQAYGGPNQGQSSPCQCSTVVYSMVAACGACQSALIDTCVKPTRPNISYLKFFYLDG